MIFQIPQAVQIVFLAIFITTIQTQEITTLQPDSSTFEPTTPNSLENVSADSSESDPKFNINSTIDEVQRLLALDPNLPRLSRTQIIDLIDNITQTDQQKAETTTESDSDSEKSREEYQRSIMYVLPYNPNNYSNMAELYTKPPMIQIVGTNKEEIPRITTPRPIQTRRTTQEPSTTRRSTTLEPSTTRRYVSPIQKTNLKPKQKVHVKLTSENGIQGSTTEKVHITQNIAPVPTVRTPNEYDKVPFVPIDLTIPQIVLPSKDSKEFGIVTTTTEYVAKVPKAPYLHRGSLRYPNHRYPEQELEHMKPTPFATRAPETALKEIQAPNLTKQKTHEKPLDSYKQGE